jgi:hypothetical protein
LLSGKFPEPITTSPAAGAVLAAPHGGVASAWVKPMARAMTNVVPTSMTAAAAARIRVRHDQRASEVVVIRSPVTSGIFGARVISMRMIPGAVDQKRLPTTLSVQHPSHLDRHQRDLRHDRRHDGTVNLRAHSDNDWVTAESDGNSPLIANRTAIGPWEEFDLIFD